MTHKTFIHYLLISVLLLSQWFTVSAMACSFASPSGQPTSMAMQASSDMPCHQGSQTVSATHQHASDQTDCCDNNCHCPSGACFSVLLSNNNKTPGKAINPQLDCYQFSSLTTALKQQQKPPQLA